MIISDDEDFVFKSELDDFNFGLQRLLVLYEYFDKDHDTELSGALITMETAINAMKSRSKSLCNAWNLNYVLKQPINKKYDDFTKVEYEILFEMATKQVIEANKITNSWASWNAKIEKNETLKREWDRFLMLLKLTEE